MFFSVINFEVASYWDKTDMFVVILVVNIRIGKARRFQGGWVHNRKDAANTDSKP